MPVLSPTLVAADLDLADEVQTTAEQAVCGRLRRCTFSDCRKHIAWQKPGLLILVAATSNDWPLVSALVCERALRRSPLTVVVVYAAGLGDGGALPRLATLTVG